MSKPYARMPLGYDGSRTTTRKLADLLPPFLKKISEKAQIRPQDVLEAWPKVVGEKLAPMTQAMKFDSKVLYVKVKNTTLLSLLSNPRDKERLIGAMQKLFPKLEIENILFRAG